MDDFESMHQWHPQMMLVSKSPITWYGFLVISSTSKSGETQRLKLKLIVPNYPSLRSAKLYFGEKVAYFCNREFRQRVTVLLHSSLNVSSFLRQIQSLIGRFFDGTWDPSSYEVDNNVIDTLKEFENALEIASDVRVRAVPENGWDIIQLTLNNVSLKLQRTRDKDIPWRVLSSDLPEISAFGPFETNVTTLSDAVKKFEKHVKMLEKAWGSLREIDEHCYIIDPAEPKPCHLYRRIFLSPLLSILMKTDPLNPADLPEIKFLGSEVEVESKKDVIFNNIQNWDPNLSLLTNLMMLLDIHEFPQKQLDNSSRNDGGIITDEECCICFSLEIDGQNFPDKICNNEKCMRHFHTSCLLQWLQAVPGNHFAFNHVHGSCPHCGESISCPID